MRHIEISGPPHFTSWSECYSLLTAALVGFNAVGLGPMLDYSRLIGKYAAWVRISDLATIVPMRCSLSLGAYGAAQESPERNSVAAIALGQAPAVHFDKERLWDSVWSAAVDD